MAKKVVAQITLQVPAGQASAGPPVGPTLGQHGINIPQFVKQYNEQTAHQVGMIVPVLVTVYADKSFSFELKTPPAAALIRKAAGIEKGSSEPNRNKVGQITREQLRQIAQEKLQDLNTKDLEAGVKILEGTARSMGVVVV